MMNATRNLLVSASLSSSHRGATELMLKDQCHIDAMNVSTVITGKQRSSQGVVLIRLSSVTDRSVLGRDRADRLRRNRRQ